MSQITGSTSASNAVQRQYLRALQQANAGSLQPNASDPMSFGIDPFSGPSGQTSGGSAPPFSLDAMSALMAAQEQSSATGLSPHQQDVFGKLDADGDGKITSTELQSAFGTDNTGIANYVMSKLDTDGDGAINQSEFGAGTTRGMGHHHHHHMRAAAADASQEDQGAQGAQDPLAALLSTSADGASSQTTTNSDGSSTTTITYAEGSKVSMTSAANASTSRETDASASSSPAQQQQQQTQQQQTQQQLTQLQQLIKRQAQMTQNFQASTPLVTT